MGDPIKATKAHPDDYTGSHHHGPYSGFVIVPEAEWVRLRQLEADLKALVER